MKSQFKWGVGVIIFSFLILALIDFIFNPVSSDDRAGVNIVKHIYVIPLLVFGVAIIIFRNREGKIEQIREAEK